MVNPFKELGKPKLDNPRGEEVGGAFSCQECYEVVHEARYLEEIKVLTWICPDGHISKIEDFHIE